MKGPAKAVSGTATLQKMINPPLPFHQRWYLRDAAWNSICNDGKAQDSIFLMIVVFVHFVVLLFFRVSAYMKQQKLEHPFKYHFWSTFSTLFTHVFSYFRGETPGNHQTCRLKMILCQ